MVGIYCIYGRIGAWYAHVEFIGYPCGRIGLLLQEIQGYTQGGYLRLGWIRLRTCCGNEGNLSWNSLVIGEA